MGNFFQRSSSCSGNVPFDGTIDIFPRMVIDLWTRKFVLEEQVVDRLQYVLGEVAKISDFVDDVHRRQQFVDECLLMKLVMHEPIRD